MRKYPGVPEALTRLLGERLREVLPASYYHVDIRGPVLEVKWGAASSASGIVGLELGERGTPEEKLTRVFYSAGMALRDVVCGVGETRGAREQTLDEHMADDHEPHVEVTDDLVLLWWGSAPYDAAATRLRPIPRSELGL
jgi:hypothetical protein